MIPDIIIMHPKQLEAYKTLMLGYYFNGNKMFVNDILILELV